MEYEQILLKNNSTGKHKIAPLGFSWAFLILGGLEALSRGDIKWFLIVSIINLSMFVITPLFTIGIIIFNIFMAFNYNNIYIKELLKKDFYPANKAQIDFLKNKGIIN